MLRKAMWFFLIFVLLMAAAGVALAAMEPGSTSNSELSRAMGRAIVPVLLVTTALYFIAKRLGWILRAPRG